MAGQRIILDLPDDVYARLKHDAEQAHRSVEEQALDVLAGRDSGIQSQQSDVAELTAQLTALGDDALRRMTQARVPARSLARLRRLHDKQQREGLDEAEAREAAALTRQYERTVFTRAQALALLKQRGYDVSALLPSA